MRNNMHIVHQKRDSYIGFLLYLHLIAYKTTVKMTISAKSALMTWWRAYSSEFLSKKIQLGKSPALPLIQREYADPTVNPNAKQSTLKGCPVDEIPCIEITPLYRILDPNEHGILFVNCNPSGTDYKYYRDYYQRHAKTCPDFFLYDKEDNSYFNAAKKFAKDAGVSINESNLDGNYAMIDIFPLVIQNQAVLKEAYYNATEDRRKAFTELLNIFIDNVLQIKPKVIVATNAFVKDLLTSDKDYSLKKLNLLKSTYEGDKFVRYKIEIQGFTSTLFCGGMIAGGHQMDTESRNRLNRDVRHFFSGNPIPIA